ncbi:MAG TPA: hypothetical protein VLU91_00185 [Nitrososphaerales archaeon]|nr:hypothetical protein [Nitrososphaerales archaeon]
MQEEIEPDSGGTGNGVVAGATFLIVGLAVPILFSGMARGEDFPTSMLILGAFAVCIIYGEYYLTLTSGVAFGTGLTMTSLVSFDWWFAVLAVAATLLNIERRAVSNHQGLGMDEEDGLESMDRNHVD